MDHGKSWRDFRRLSAQSGTTVRWSQRPIRKEFSRLDDNNPPYHILGYPKGPRRQAPPLPLNLRLDPSLIFGPEGRSRAIERDRSPRTLDAIIIRPPTSPTPTPLPTLLRARTSVSFPPLLSNLTLAYSRLECVRDAQQLQPRHRTPDTKSFPPYLRVGFLSYAAKVESYCLQGSTRGTLQQRGSGPVKVWFTSHQREVNEEDVTMLSLVCPLSIFLRLYK